MLVCAVGYGHDTYILAKDTDMKMFCCNHYIFVLLQSYKRSKTPWTLPQFHPESKLEEFSSPSLQLDFKHKMVIPEQLMPTLQLKAFLTFTT